MSEKAKVDHLYGLKKTIGKRTYAMGFDIPSTTISRFAEDLSESTELLSRILSLYPDESFEQPISKERIIPDGLLEFTGWTKLSGDSPKILEPGSHHLFLYLPQFAIGEDMQKHSHPYYGICVARIDRNTYLESTKNGNNEVIMTAIPLVEIEYHPKNLLKKLTISDENPRWFANINNKEDLKSRVVKYNADRQDLHYFI